MTFDAATLGVPVTLASPAGQPPEGSRFSVTSRAVYALWGLGRLKQPSLRKALAAQLAGGSGVADLKIKVRSRWSDILITALTAGLIVRPASLHCEETRPARAPQPHAHAGPEPSAPPH